MTIVRARKFAILGSVVGTLSLSIISIEAVSVHLHFHFGGDGKSGSSSTPKPPQSAGHTDYSRVNPGYTEYSEYFRPRNDSTYSPDNKRPKTERKSSQRSDIIFDYSSDAGFGSIEYDYGSDTGGARYDHGLGYPKHHSLRHELGYPKHALQLRLGLLETLITTTTLAGELAVILGACRQRGRA